MTELAPNFPHANLAPNLTEPSGVANAGVANAGVANAGVANAGAGSAAAGGGSLRVSGGPPSDPGDLQADGVDAELMALPAPPRRDKMLTLAALAAVAAAALGLTLSLRGDVHYALTSPAPESLGDLRDVAASQLRTNTYVSGHAAVGAADAVRYERPFVDGSFRLAPVLGRNDLWVELKVPPKSENGRFIPPAQFRGRLVRFGEAGSKHRGLATALASAGEGAANSAARADHLPESAWLLVADEAPSDARWALALSALCVAFVAFCAVAIRKLTRRIEV